MAEPTRTALQESVSLLADCHEHEAPEGKGDGIVLTTMTSDPGFGTVIDTSEIPDYRSQTMSPALVERPPERIDSLALPPLGAGGKLSLLYTLSFHDEDGGTLVP